jgi:hypothetical protein
MLELFAIGTLMFWALLFVIAVIITILVENEAGPWATTAAIVTAVALNWLWKVPILHASNEHKLASVLWLLVYYAVGIGWGFVKWASFVHKKVGAYNEFKSEFLKENKVTELTPILAVKLQDKIRGGYSSRHIMVSIPTASENKGSIIRWMTYWPFSIVGTILNDVVRKLWHHIYMFLATTYDRLASRLWRGVSADMAMAEQFKAKLEAEDKAKKDEAKAKQEADFDTRYKNR